MIDETGKRVWEETFDLWGKPHDRLETRVVGGAILTNVKPREANKNQAISQPFRFPGQYHDEETGLYYNRYRYYMPNEGMYTQRDPIGLAGGNPTTYGYVFNTLQEVDPFGLNRITEPIRIIFERREGVQHVIERHMGRIGMEHKSRWTVPNGQWRSITRSTFRNPDRVLFDSDTRRWTFERAYRKPIGINSTGKKVYFQRVVLESDGRLVTSFPQENMKEQLGRNEKVVRGGC